MLFLKSSSALILFIKSSSGIDMNSKIDMSKRCDLNYSPSFCLVFLMSISDVMNHDSRSFHFLGSHPVLMSISEVMSISDLDFRNSMRAELVFRN